MDPLLPAASFIEQSLATLQIGYTDSRQGFLQWDGQQYTVKKQGFFATQFCMVGPDQKIVLTVKRANATEHKLCFSNTNQYQQEWLTYAAKTLIIYNDTVAEILRLTAQPSTPERVCLTITEANVPLEELSILIAWSFYFFRLHNRTGRKAA